MIEVLFTEFTSPLSHLKYKQFLSRLPQADQLQIAKFRNWQDAHRTLLGKNLLLTAIQNAGYKLELSDLNYTEFQKPFFKEDFHFNISHSGNLVVCAIARSPIGIDIEEIKNIPLHDFETLFSDGEQQFIFSEPGNLLPFYTLWTQKEAFLKALGTGLSLPLNEVVINNNIIKYQSDKWFLQLLTIKPGYVCHVASKTISEPVILKQVDF